MANVFNIYGKLSFNTATGQAQLQQAGTQFSNILRAWEYKAGAVAKSLKSLGSQFMLLGGAGALGAVAAFRGIVEGASEVINISKQLGVAPDAVKKLSFAAKMADLDLETVGKALGKMQKGLGSGSQNGTLRKMGLDPKALKNMGADKAMAEIIDALARQENSAVRTAYAMEIFGKSGNQMLQFVKDGKSELGGFIEKAGQIGVAMSPEKAAMFERIEEKMKLFGAESKLIFDSWETKFGIFLQKSQ